MTEQRRIQCVFYSHVWAIHILQQANLGPMSNTVLVELAVQSNLAPVFRAQKKERYGLAGLLAFNDCLDKIGTTYQQLSAPIVLAPNPMVTEATLESAVALLATTEGPYDKATLLVHINDAPQFSDAYQHVDEFHILWDLADAPNVALQNLCAILAKTHCLNQDTWGGFHLCSHPMRPLADADERRTMFDQIIGEHPALAVAA